MNPVNAAAEIIIYKSTTLHTTYELLGADDPEVSFLADFSSYGEIDKIDLMVSDAAGLTYDTFPFTIEV